MYCTYVSTYTRLINSECHFWSHCPIELPALVKNLVGEVKQPYRSEDFLSHLGDRLRTRHRSQSVLTQLLIKVGQTNLNLNKDRL
jgi:hypothetical protein